MASRTLDVKISASDSASAVFEKVGDSAKDMATSIEDAAKSSEGLKSFSEHVKSLDSEIKTVGQAFTGLGAGITGAIAVSVSQFAGLESAMANVSTIAGQSDQWIQQMTGNLRELAIELGTSPTGLAEGLYDIIGSGIEAADAFDVLRTSAIAAKAGLTDTGTAARAITAILNAYGKSAEEAGNVSDVLFKVVDSGVISFEQLANNLGNTIPLASQLGVTIEELGAAYSLLTVNGVQAAQAETQIAALMRATINETEALTEAVREYGYESAEALIQTEGLAGFLTFLMEQSGGSSSALRELLGTAEAVNAALILSKNSGDDYVAMLGEMEMAAQGGQFTLGVFEEQMNTISGAFARLRAQLGEVSLSIGEAFAPLARVGIDGAAAAVGLLSSAIGSLPGPLQTAAAGVAGLTGGFSLLTGAMLLMLPRIVETRAALQAIGGFRGMLGLLTAAFNPLTLAITGAIGGFVLIAENMRRGAEDARNYAQSVTQLAEAVEQLRIQGDETRADFLEGLQQEIDAVVSDEAIDAAIDAYERLDLARQGIDPTTFSNILAADFDAAIAMADEVNIQIAKALTNPNIDAAAYTEWVTGLLDTIVVTAEGSNIDEVFNEILTRPLSDFRLEGEEAATVFDRLAQSVQGGLGTAFQQLDDQAAMMENLTARAEDFATTLDDIKIEGDFELAAQLQELDELFQESADSSEAYLDAQDRIFSALQDGSINFATVAAEVQRLNDEYARTGDQDAYEQGIIELASSLHLYTDGSQQAIERTRELTQEFTEAAFAIAGWDNALSQLNMTGLTDDLALFAEEGIRTGQAFDNTFRILVTNVQAIGSSVQQATDWLSGMFAVNDEGFSQMDTLVWENRISWEQYEATLGAWNTTAEANYDIQQNLLAVQAMQAPYIAEAVEGTRAWVAELANMDAQTQRTTLAFMDMQTVQQAQEIIALGNSEAFLAMGESGRTAFEAVIQGALQTNPLLFDVLETMGIINGTPVDFDINWDALAEGGSAMQQLTQSVDDLVSTLREIYGLPPLDIPITVNGSEGGIETVLDDVELVYDRVTNLDGTESYFVLRASVETGELEDFGTIIDSYTDPDDPNIAYILVEADTGNFITTIEKDTGDIGDVRVPVSPEMTDDWQSIAQDTFIDGEVVIPVRPVVQTGNVAVGDGTGGAQNWNDLLDVPDEVITTIRAIVEGQDEAESVSTAIENIPDSKNATVSITVTGLEDLESAKTAIDELADKTVTVSIIGDAGGADGVLTVLDNIKSGGKDGHQVTVKLVADDSDVTSTIASLSGAPGGGSLPGEPGGPTITVHLKPDTSALSLESLNLGSLYPDGLEISVAVTTTGHDTAVTNLNNVQSAAEAVPTDVATTTTVYAWVPAVNNLNSVQSAAEAIPTSVTTGVNVSGWVSAVAALNSVASAARSIPASVSTTVTTNLVTNRITNYSTSGVRTAFALGGIAGLPRFAGGGMVPIWAGENGGEVAHFATGGAALLPREGMYEVPMGAYISPAHANPPSGGGVYIDFRGSSFVGTSRAEMDAWAEEDLIPRVERAVNQRFAGKGT